MAGGHSSPSPVLALRHDCIEGPWPIDGPRTYVQKLRAPTLRPGELVIMDNLGSHKGKADRHTIRSAGTKLLLPPDDSPDLNPIEQVFAKLNHLLPKVAARTVEAVVAAIGPTAHRPQLAGKRNYFTTPDTDDEVA